MKIGNSADQAELAAAAVRSATESGKTRNGEEAATAKTGGAPNAVEDSAKVHLSASASLLSTPGGGTVFDSEKVARVQEAIANGTYVINPEAIASRLIANAKEVLANARSADSQG